MQHAVDRLSRGASWSSSIAVSRAMATGRGQRGAHQRHAGARHELDASSGGAVEAAGHDEARQIVREERAHDAAARRPRAGVSRVAHLALAEDEDAPGAQVRVVAREREPGLLDGGS